MSDPKLLNALGLTAYARNILQLTGQHDMVVLHDAILAIDERVNVVSVSVPGHTVEEIKDIPALSESLIRDPHGSFAGKLSIKKEPAGKLRVFAMATVWDQTVLSNVHDMLFAFLRNLPNDGTFDQHASEMRARSKSINAGRSYGYDLTAATDRLPLNIQADLLNLILPDLGDNWSLLLTKREYFMMLPEECLSQFGIPENKAQWYKLSQRGGKAPTHITLKGDIKLPLYFHVYTTMGGTVKIRPYVVLKYAVGQPMGALSSWAMLAVTHHLIVQYAYRVAYGVPMSLVFNKDTWYTNYEVLGDDIILFDKDVAKQYLIMMESLGVPINTSKSVCATVAVTEYAKVTSLNGQNVSALSWKMFMSGNSLMGRVNIIFSLLSRGIIAKYNIIPWITRSAAQSLHRPGNLNPTLIALWTMLSNKGLLPLEEALKALISGKDKVFRLAKAILYNADVNKIKLALPSLISDKKLILTESNLVKRIWAFEFPWMKITMWKPLAVYQAKRDLERDVSALAKAVFLVMLPKMASSPWKMNSEGVLENTLDFTFEECCTFEFRHGEFYTNGAPDLEKVSAMPNSKFNDYVVLYTSLYNMLFEKAEKLGGTDAISNLEMDSPLEDLVLGNDKLDRYNELLLLESRYQAKVDPSTEVIPPRLVRPTELKMIKLLSKMGDRPAFTTALSMDGSRTPGNNTQLRDKIRARFHMKYIIPGQIKDQIAAEQAAANSAETSPS